jgi:hypothetical protein
VTPPTELRILEAARRIVGPGGAALISDALNEVSGRYSIPPNTYARTSVYLGPGEPTLHRLLRNAFLTIGDPSVSPRDASRLAANYAAAEPIYSDLALLTVVVLREHDSGLLAAGTNPIDTYTHGGMDQLALEMRRMDFLPADVRDRWVPAVPGMATERVRRRVHPALIPARDQMTAYAAMLRRREDIFRGHVGRLLRTRGASMLAGLSVPERRTWTQLAFGRQGGHDFRPARSERPAALTAEAQQFAGDHAGLVTVLGALAYADSQQGTGDAFVRYVPTLGAILNNEIFSHMASVRIARVRAVEAEVLERLGLVPRASRLTH